MRSSPDSSTRFSPSSWTCPSRLRTHVHELFVDDLAAKALPRHPPLLTCFDLEEVSVAATFGLAGVRDLAVFGLARTRGAAVSTLAGLSTVVISALCTVASDSPPLVDLDSDSPRASITSPPVQTLALSSQSMPALPQPALVSGWLECRYEVVSPTRPWMVQLLRPGNTLIRRVKGMPADWLSLATCP